MEDNATAPQAPPPPAPERTRLQRLPPHLSRLAVLISEGCTAKEIGASMILKEGTVKVYTNDLYRRFGVQDRGNCRVRLVLAVLNDLASAPAVSASVSEPVLEPAANQ